jgi:hypothetical protein
MATICSFEFWNITPHLETSFELVKIHFDAGDQCHYFFCGHDLEDRQGILSSPRQIKIKMGLARLPECRAASLVESENLFFTPESNRSLPSGRSPKLRGGCIR